MLTFTVIFHIRSWVGIITYRNNIFLWCVHSVWKCLGNRLAWSNQWYLTLLKLIVIHSALKLIIFINFLVKLCHNSFITVSDEQEFILIGWFKFLEQVINIETYLWKPRDRLDVYLMRKWVVHFIRCHIWAAFEIIVLKLFIVHSVISVIRKTVMKLVYRAAVICHCSLVECLDIIVLFLFNLGNIYCFGELWQVGFKLCSLTECLIRVTFWLWYCWLCFVIYFKWISWFTS